MRQPGEPLLAGPVFPESGLLFLGGLSGLLSGRALEGKTVPTAAGGQRSRNGPAADLGVNQIAWGDSRQEMGSCCPRLCEIWGRDCFASN